MSQVRDVANGVNDAVEILAFNPEIVRQAEPDSEKNSVVVLSKLVELEVDAECCVVANFDATDRQNVVNLSLSKFIDSFVGSDTVFV